jgi:hypothetical protein
LRQNHNAKIILKNRALDWNCSPWQFIGKSSVVFWAIGMEKPDILPVEKLLKNIDVLLGKEYRTNFHISLKASWQLVFLAI